MVYNRSNEQGGSTIELQLAKDGMYVESFRVNYPKMPIVVFFVKRFGDEGNA